MEEIKNNIIKYKQIDSTQKEAKRILKNNPTNGTVIITEEQTDGIGTHGRKWYTQPNDNITFTAIYYPNCTIEKLNGITIKIAEEIVKTINILYNISLQIKHPNDIMLNEKKLGGILTETILSGEKVKCLIIGIGLNINQEYFPEEIKNIATSLKKETNKEYNKEIIFREIINVLNKIVNKIKEEKQ